MATGLYNSLYHGTSRDINCGKDSHQKLKSKLKSKAYTMLEELSDI